MREMLQPTTKAQRRRPEDVARIGLNAVIAEEIPAIWVVYFANDEWNPDDDAEPQWAKQKADRWAAEYAERGYIFSGPDGGQKPEPDEFNGLWGTLQRVHLVNDDVIHADRRAGRFSVHGADDKPSEYVLRFGLEAAIVLPECFEPRINDPDADTDDPSEAETPRDSALQEPGAEPRNGRETANHDTLDNAWTAAAADRTKNWLADHGWEVECLLPGTEHDGWYQHCRGRVALYLARRSESTRNEYAPVFHDGGPAHWPGAG